MSQSTVNVKVLVVIGAGGMGKLAARRLGPGRHILLADYSETALKSTVNTLKEDGHDVSSHTVDVSDYSSVLKMAQDAASLGPIDAIVHTAGVSPTQASSDRIYKVDLLGTCNVIDAFVNVVSPGTSLVCISSMAGHFAQTSAGLDQHLGTASRDQLLDHSEIDLKGDPGQAYTIAKKGNILRVQAAAKKWGERGARLNSISPGVISTPMGQSELDGPAGGHMKALIAMSGSGRIGTPDDIVDVVDFLVGRQSSFITGNDILVDGGAVAGQRWASR